MCWPVRCTDKRGRSPERLLIAVRTRRRRRSKRESFAILLLLSFLAEDKLAAITDALALVGFGLAPAADFGRELADLLLVDTADLDRGLVGRLDFKTLGNLEIDIVAVAKLQLQRSALCRSTIADAGDVEHPGKARGHAFDQVRHQRALHAPKGPCGSGII